MSQCLRYLPSEELRNEINLKWDAEKIKVMHPWISKFTPGEEKVEGEWMFERWVRVGGDEDNELERSRHH